MKLTAVEFLEPVKSPRPGQGQPDTVTKLASSDTTSLELTPLGVRISVKGADVVAVVPLGNVRWCHGKDEEKKK